MIQTLSCRFGVPRFNNVSQNSKIPEVAHLKLVWHYQKMPKWHVLRIGCFEYHPRTRTEQINSMLLTFGDHDKDIIC